VGGAQGAFDPVFLASRPLLATPPKKVFFFFVFFFFLFSFFFCCGFGFFFFFFFFFFFPLFPSLPLLFAGLCVGGGVPSFSVCVVCRQGAYV